jgi:hypothetical protein
VVKGLNFRLTISIDSQSSTQYVIVVYQTLQGALSISSCNLANVKSTYSFGNALTASQIAALPYLNSLNSAVSRQLPNLVTAGTAVDALFKDFPYFRLVMRNSAYREITLVVLYDVLKNNLTVLEQNLRPVPSPAPTPAPAPVSPVSSSQPSFAGFEPIGA